jgi:hypothetical protein
MKNHHLTRIPFEILSFLKLLPHACSGLHWVKSLRIASMAVFAFALSAIPTVGAFELPLEVSSHNATSVEGSVNVPLSSVPDKLFLRIHNLRFGGQVSVKINTGEWLSIYNHTAIVISGISYPVVDNFELSQGGIGGLNATISLSIKLKPGQALVGQNSVSLRLNGTNGIVSAVRLVDLDFLNTAGNRVVDINQKNFEDPTNWRKPASISAAEIAAGKSLWRTAVLKENPFENGTIKANCMSCHFEDGSDLKYFNFSDKSIVTRAQFHGLTKEQGEHIARYIRSSTKPNPGRPWNPPFQPGPVTNPNPGQLTLDTAGQLTLKTGKGLDPLKTDDSAEVKRKVASWLAGAGLNSVNGNNSEVLDQVFPNGTLAANIADVIDHNGNFSVRQISVPYQFPDWNAWLPHYAPEDIWPADTTPQNLLKNLEDALSQPGAVSGEGPLEDPAAGGTLASSGMLISTFDAFNKGLENWYGQFRIMNNDFPVTESTVSLARDKKFTREDAIKGLSHWMVVKIIENVRAYDIEGKHDNVTVMQGRGHPKFTPDSLLMPGNVKLSSVFTLAPHIIGNNWDHFADQPTWLGKMESNQWYHLSLCLNSGSRMSTNDNVPLDWDYQLLHLQEASERSGIQYGIQNLITQIKMYQSRDNGKGVDIKGFDPRYMTPWKLYSDQFRDQSLFKGVINEAKPDLWRKTYEQFLYEYLDVMESMDSNDPLMVPRRALDADLGINKLVEGGRHRLEEVGYTPQDWSPMVDRNDVLVPNTDKFFVHPGEVYADLMFRLMKLLPKEGIDIVLLDDLRQWCKRVWPAGPWESRFNVDNFVYYKQNFEDENNQADFEGISAFTTIKSGKGVNLETFKPRGGGRKFVAQSILAPNGNQTGTKKFTTAISLPLGTKTLKLRARTAFKDEDGVNPNPGTVKFKMQVMFDNSTALISADEDTLNAALFDKKFQSYERVLAVPTGATKIKQLVVSWKRTDGVGNVVVYIDNIHIVKNKLMGTTVPNTPTSTAATVYTSKKDIEAFIAPTIDSFTNSDGAIVKSFKGGGGTTLISKLPPPQSKTPATYPTYIRVTWNAPTTQPLDGIAGYNIYRKVFGTTPAEVKINTGLVDKPYNWFDDYVIAEGATYEYKVTTVSANGKESVKSAPINVAVGVSVVNPPNTPETPKTPKKFWAKHVPAVPAKAAHVLVGWFPSKDWDVVRYEVLYRRQNTNTFTSFTTGEPFFEHFGVSSGATFYYKVTAIDSNGNKSPESPTINISIP